MARLMPYLPEGSLLPCGLRGHEGTASDRLIEKGTQPVNVSSSSTASMSTGRSVESSTRLVVCITPLRRSLQYPE